MSKQTINYDNNLVPILIELKSLSKYIKEKKERGEVISLVDYTISFLKNCFLENFNLTVVKKFVLDMFTHGTAILLLDALDEIGNTTSQKEIRDLIRTTSQKYKNIKIIVTSRPLGYNLVSIPESDFIHCNIVPIRPYNQRKYIYNWFSIIESDKKVIDMKTSNLINLFNKNPTLSALASNPLILSLMIIIYKHENSIPIEHYYLYSQLSKTFLFSRDKFKELLIEDNFSDLEQIFAQIAFTMQSRIDSQNRSLEITEQDLRETLIVYFEENHELDTKKSLIVSKTFIEELKKRSSVIIPNNSNFNFWHRSFQEYYCSLYLRSLFLENSTLFWNLFKEKIKEMHWWEILHLSIDSLGEIKRKIANDVIKEITAIFHEESHIYSYLIAKIAKKLIINDNIRDDMVNYLINSLDRSEANEWMPAFYELLSFPEFTQEIHYILLMNKILCEPEKFKQTMQSHIRIIPNPLMEMLLKLFNINQELFLGNFSAFLEKNNQLVTLELFKLLKNNKEFIEPCISILSFQNLKIVDQKRWHLFRLAIKAPNGQKTELLEKYEEIFTYFTKRFPIVKLNEIKSILKELILYFLSLYHKQSINLKRLNSFSEPFLIHSNKNNSEEETSFSPEEIQVSEGLNILSDAIIGIFKVYKPIKTHVKYIVADGEKNKEYFSFGFEFQMESFKDYHFPINIEMINDYYKYEKNEIRYKVYYDRYKYAMAFRLVLKNREDFKTALSMLKDKKELFEEYGFRLVDKEEFLFFKLAIKCYQSKKYKKALEFVNKIEEIEFIEKNIKNSSLKLRAETLANLHKYRESQKICEQYKSSVSEDNWYFVQSMLNHINMQSFNETLEIIKILELKNDLKPNESRLMLENKAIALYHTDNDENVDHAFGIINELIQEQFDNHKYYYHKAKILVKQEKFKECISVVESRYKDRYEEYPLILEPWLSSLLSLKEYSKGLELFKIIEEKNIDLGFLLTDLDDEEFIKKVLELYPENKFGLMSIACIERGKGNLSKSIKIFESLTEKYVEDSFIWFLRGELEKEDGLIEQGKRSIKRSFSLRSEMKKYKGFFSRIKINDN
jgi:hypothetical protein